VKVIPYLFYPAVLLLAGCGSVSVRPESASSSALPHSVPPRQILVSDFSYDGANVRADRDGKELADFKQKMNDDLSRDLLHSLTPFGIPALKVGARPSKLIGTQAAWLIEGHYKRIFQGSRALRSFVGFGSGATKLETEVEVYDLGVPSSAPILTFQTTGGSGAEPGGLLSANPVGFVMGVGGKAVSTGLSVDTKRTARMIADYVSTELAAHGFIAEDKARRAKIAKAD
jgi:hypothetical protein